MDKQLFQNYSDAERIQMLSDNAERKEEFQYPRELASDEISELKDNLSNESIRLSRLDEKRKDAMAEFKTEMKPIKTEVARILRLLRTKNEEVEEKVYLIADQDEGMMGYYNSKGLLVHSRLLRGEEKQLRIISNNDKKAN